MSTIRFPHPTPPKRLFATGRTQHGELTVKHDGLPSDVEHVNCSESIVSGRIAPGSRFVGAVAMTVPERPWGNGLLDSALGPTRRAAAALDATPTDALDSVLAASVLVRVADELLKIAASVRALAETLEPPEAA